MLGRILGASLRFSVAAVLLSLYSPSAFASDFVCRPRPMLRTGVVQGLAEAWARGNQPVRILAIGSSSTEGIGASTRDRAYPARLGALLRQSLPGRAIEIVNAGIGGETAPQTLERLRDRLGDARYDLVIWQVGTNDAVTGGDLDVFRSLLARGIETTGRAGARLVLLDPQFYPGIRDQRRYKDYVDAIAETAQRSNVPVLGRYAAMSEWFGRDAEGFMAALAGDRFHMSDAGYACLAHGIALSLLGPAVPSLTIASDTSGPRTTGRNGQLPSP